AIEDVLEVCGALSAEQNAKAKAVLDRVVALLVCYSSSPSPTSYQSGGGRRVRDTRRAVVSAPRQRCRCITPHRVPGSRKLDLRSRPLLDFSTRCSGSKQSMIQFRQSPLKAEQGFSSGRAIKTRAAENKRQMDRR